MTAPLLLLLLTPSVQGTVDWDHRAAEHLLNRAGFGAPTLEVERWVEAGQDALVDHLLGSLGPAAPWAYEAEMPTLESLRGLDQQQRVREVQRLRQAMTQEAVAYAAEWTSGMVSGEDPLRDRMRLFWHGLFTSSQRTVKRGDYMIKQAELIDEHALGNYGDLLRGILRDPAMLVYLDNISNRKRKPNENLAREVLELFSLGEGNYTEQDIKEAARALTGNGVARSTTPGGRFSFQRRDHDFGPKTIFGQEGRFDSASLVDLILEQPACARWIAGRIVEYFEGTPPEEQRLEAYATLLRRSGYEVRPLLRALFMDPEFYADEVVGARILSPLDYLVGAARRMRIAPSGEFLTVAAGVLGERLFDPPNVKGWEGGMAWITTSTLMGRGNVIGVMLGLVRLDDLGSDEELMEAMSEEGMEMAQMEPSTRMSKAQVAPDLVRAMRALRGRGPRKAFRPPATNFRRSMARQNPESDAQVVDLALEELLGIVPPPETALALTRFLTQEREALGLDLESFFRRGGAEAEDVLRRLAHLILSLPESQLG